MRNNITIKKTWEDTEFFSANIICSSEMVTAKTDVYISNENFRDLHRKIMTFLEGKNIDRIYWESGTKGDVSTACVSFLFHKADKRGHISIEVFMEIGDGGKLSEHTCCFYVNTEYGLLLNFCEKLARLKENSIGYEIQLNKMGDGSVS